MKKSELKFNGGDNDYLYGCIFDERLEEKTMSILSSATDTMDFVSRFLDSEEPEIIMSQAYAELSKKVCPNGHWTRIRQMLGDKVFKTMSDIGGVKIGNDKFTVIIPNGYGDGDTRIAIVNRGEINDNMFNFFAFIEGNINIYSYDCGDDVVRTISGKYGVYYWEGFVIFEKR